MFLKYSKVKKGFTLIELMVASSIFIIVMVISVGSVLSIVDANRKAQSLNSVMTNLNFAVESMVRDIREGQNFPSDAQCNASSLQFMDSDGDTVTYSYNSLLHEIDKDVDSPVNGYTSSSITASEVVINGMSFCVRGSAPSPDTKQPVILVTIFGTAGSTAIKTKTDFRLETVITQRVLDH